MNRRLLQWGIAFTVIAGWGAAAIAADALPAGRRPNILLFVVDDLGYDDLPANGNTYARTPAIDQLRESSVVFNDFSVASVCAPTRASLLTGRHYWRTGVSHVHGGGDYLNRSEETIADVLRGSGYATGMWGKWHSGKTEGYFPWDRGFDDGYYAELYKHENARGWHNGKYVEHERWSPQVLTDYAVDFIDRHQDRPFFAYVSYLSVHEPWDAPRDRVAAYEELGVGPRLATIYAMLESVDASIGRILARVKDLGLDDHTMVVFMSDNGPIMGNSNALGNLTEEEWARRNQYNRLRGNKGTVWQNGVRSPLYVRWSAATAGEEIETAVCVADLFPTFVEIAGAVRSEGAKALDGQSLVPLLTGRPHAFPDRILVDSKWRPLLHGRYEKEYYPVQAQRPDLYPFDRQPLYARNNRFKLLFNASGLPRSTCFLVDLDADPQEQTNVIDDYPDVARELEDAMRAWYGQMMTSPDHFARPVYLIGGGESATSEVRGCGPSRIGGNADNQVHVLNGLRQRGDFAEWEIEVIRPGRYTIALETNGDAHEGIAIALTVGDTTVNATLNALQTQSVGSLDLPEGRRVLRLEVTGTDNPDAVLDQVRKLLFHESDRSPDTTPRPW